MCFEIGDFRKAEYCVIWVVEILVAVMEFETDGECYVEYCRKIMVLNISLAMVEL